MSDSRVNVIESKLKWQRLMKLKETLGHYCKCKKMVEECGCEKARQLRDVQEKLQKEREKNAKLELELLIQGSHVKIAQTNMSVQMQIAALESAKKSFDAKSIYSDLSWPNRAKNILHTFTNKMGFGKNEADLWSCLVLKKGGYATNKLGAALSENIKVHILWETFDVYFFLFKFG